MDKPTLEFDDACHIYRYGGRIVPNVTSVLSPLHNFDGIPDRVLANAQRRGTAVHRACELHLLDDLDEMSLHPEIQPYFWMFLKFLRESGFKTEETERRVYSARYGFAGTYDLYGLLNRKRALIDIKTPVVMHPATGPQTAAYEAAKREIDGIAKKTVIHRYGLKLQPNHYELIPFADAADFGVFLGLKALYEWRKKHATRQ